MSVVESELDKLVREFLSAHGMKQFVCMAEIRKYMRRTPFEQIQIDVGRLSTAKQLRTILGAGPPGDVYKACMARLYYIESASR